MYYYSVFMKSLELFLSQIAKNLDRDKALVSKTVRSWNKFNLVVVYQYFVSSPFYTLQNWRVRETNLFLCAGADKKADPGNHTTVTVMPNANPQDIFFYQPSHPWSYGPQSEKTCLQGFAKNKGADQPLPLQFDQRLILRLLEVLYLNLLQVKF